MITIFSLLNFSKNWYWQKKLQMSTARRVRWSTSGGCWTSSRAPPPSAPRRHLRRRRLPRTPMPPRSPPAPAPPRRAPPPGPRAGAARPRRHRRRPPRSRRPQRRQRPRSPQPRRSWRRRWAARAPGSAPSTSSSPSLTSRRHSTVSECDSLSLFPTSTWISDHKWSAQSDKATRYYWYLSKILIDFSYKASVTA